MKTYQIKIGNKPQGVVRAKSAQNALVNWLKLLSATHILWRGIFANARYKTPACTDSFATVFLWKESYQRCVYATATEI